MSKLCAWDKYAKRKGALTPKPSSLAIILITCPSDWRGSATDVKPIKSISLFDVEIKIEEIKSVLSGTISSKQFQCSVPPHPVSPNQSTPVSALGLENESAKATSTVIIVITDVNVIESKTVNNKSLNFDSSNLFFSITL